MTAFARTRAAMALAGALRQPLPRTTAGREVDPDFLPGIARVTERTPRMMIWAIPLAIMAATAAALAWAWLGEIDIVSPAQGSVMPAGEVKEIQPPEDGVVADIAVAEGDLVEAGDLLLSLDPTAADAERDRLAKELSALHLRLARLRAALADDEGFQAPPSADPALMETERLLLQAGRLRLEGALAEAAQERARLAASRDATLAGVGRLEAILPLIRQRVDARRTLVEQGISSRTEFLTLRQELAEQEGDLAVMRAQLREAEAAIEAADARSAQIVRDHRLALLQELAEASRREGALVEELRGAERRLASLQLRAPVDGIVHDLAIHAEGAVVEAAEPVMRLVPTGGPLVVEARILNRDIGFVELGQPVEVKLETFAFTKYGSIPGTVVALSSAAVPDETLGPVYLARIALSRETVEVDGRLAPLAPGMAATVDIRTGRRRLIDYILAPLERHAEEAGRER